MENFTLVHQEFNNGLFFRFGQISQFHVDTLLMLLLLLLDMIVRLLLFS